jgi:regulator of protease activity HflC (stomatin/prohibitin superfamily)
MPCQSLHGVVTTKEIEKMPVIPLIIAAAAVLLGIVTVVRSVRVVPQARVAIVQRLGRYLKTADSGPLLVLPYIDKVLPVVDMREQVVAFARQAVITADNVGIQIDNVIYFQIIDAQKSTYAVANLLAAMEQFTVTTLRNVIGGLTLDKTLTSREDINMKMRASLDEVTENWGVRVNRVELRDILPPPDVQHAMEKQMQAEREKRATVLTAEGQQQAAVLKAQGEKQAAVLRAEGEKQAAILQAEGDAEALVKVQTAQAEAVTRLFHALNESRTTPEVLKYLYIQNLPKLAEGTANKLFVVPSELEGIVTAGNVLGAALAQDHGNAGGKTSQNGPSARHATPPADRAT